MDNKCAKCIGLQNCYKYCDAQVGKNIVDYVRNVDVIKTHIGEFRNDSNGVKNLLVSGFLMSEHETSLDILRSITGSSINSDKKLRSFRDKPASYFVKEYLNTLEVNKEAKNSALGVFNTFNSIYVLPVPLKAGTDVSITYTGFDGKEHNQTSVAKNVVWKIDKNGNLVGELVVATEKNFNGSIFTHAKFSDYGVTWKFKYTELGIDSKDVDYDCVKMLDSGMIKPLEIRSKRNVIMLDGSHLYTVENGSEYIVGSWGVDGIHLNEDFTHLGKTDVCKKLKTYINFLNKHRRFIAPYGVVEANKIEI